MNEAVESAMRVHNASLAAKRDYYLLGFGGRRKMIYRDHTLSDAFTGEVIRPWPEGSDIWVMPEEYKVWFELPVIKGMELSESENEIWVGNRRGFSGDDGSMGSRSQSGETLEQGNALALPTFSNLGIWGNKYHEYCDLLKILHGEILFNIKDGVPYPNIFVYDKPWYRDAAMVGMVLEKTGNLALIRDWILGLREPYDRCNAGHEEPDNLGQLLYLISLVSDKNHPLVPKILAELPRFRKDNYIVGLSDFAEHPVYQTKWLKFGLRRLRLPDPYEIPTVYDSYSALFWWDYKKFHVPGPRFGASDRQNYPYLAWAEDHFYGDPPPIEGLLMTDDFPPGQSATYTGPYPLTWEAEASQANYAGMARLSEDDARNKICRAHTWHAAEMFLYLHEAGKQKKFSLW